jgi:hypothetical protein
MSTNVSRASQSSVATDSCSSSNGLHTEILSQQDTSRGIFPVFLLCRPIDSTLVPKHTKPNKSQHWALYVEVDGTPWICEGRRKWIRLQFEDSNKNASEWLHKYGKSAWRSKICIGWTTQHRLEKIIRKGRAMADETYILGRNDCQTFANVVGEVLANPKLTPYPKGSKEEANARFLAMHHQEEYLFPRTTKWANKHGVAIHPSGAARYHDSSDSSNSSLFDSGYLSRYDD